MYWFWDGRTSGGERWDFDILESRTEICVVHGGRRGDDRYGDGVPILVDAVLMDVQQSQGIRMMKSTQTNIRSGSICSREGRVVNLDCPRGGVPVASEIMTGRAQVVGRGSYRVHSGWNLRSELAFSGITGAAESGVRKGGLVKTMPPHQYR